MKYVTQDFRTTRAPVAAGPAFGPPTAILVGFDLAVAFGGFRPPAACFTAADEDEDDFTVPLTTREPGTLGLLDGLDGLAFKVVGLRTGSAAGGGGGGGIIISSIDSLLESGEPAMLRMRESGEGTAGAYEFCLIKCCVRDGG